MLENGKKEISFSGVIYVAPGTSIVETIHNLQMVALYSPEYAGHIDVSDAGDRVDGPKVAVTIDNSMVKIEEAR